MTAPPPWAIVLAFLGGLYILIRSSVSAKTPGVQAFAQAIAGAEGYGVPNAIPTVRNNPGDIKDPSTGQIRTFATADEGWTELYRELDLILPGTAARYGYTADMTIAEFAANWTATEVDAWTNNVVALLNQQGYTVTPDTPIGQVLA